MSVSLEEIQPGHPLFFDSDNIDWLELDGPPKFSRNPFLDNDFFSANHDPLEDLTKILCQGDYLPYAAKLLLNVTTAPFQSVILDRFWSKKRPMLVGCRGMSKTFSLAVYALLRLIFHQGCNIVCVTPTFRQSKHIFEYMCKIWSNSSILQDLVLDKKREGPKRDLDRCEFRLGASTAIFIPLGDGQKIRGLRANYTIVDEFHAVPEEIYNVVVQGFGMTSSDPIEKIKNVALKKKLKKQGIWDDSFELLEQQQISGNQTIISGSAFYEFNHFAKHWKKYSSIIKSKGDPKKLKAVFAGDDGNIPKGFDWRDYCIVRVPYTHIPEGMLDEGTLAASKSTQSRAQFLMEACAIFVSDSDGFYRRSVLEAATTNRPIMMPDGEKVQFSAMKTGDKTKAYVMGIDPAADRDNAAIVVIEMGLSHRKIVYCWTTNKNKYNLFRKHKLKEGITVGEDYYRYIAKKAREIMRDFNIERVIMDKNGGGTAIAEAFKSNETFFSNEFPVYEVVDVDNPKYEDSLEGLHILNLIAPTNDLNSDANHGMLKDFQDKILLFPRFDTIEIAQAIEIDKLNNIKYDTYESLVEEIEELKNEITTVVCKPSPVLGKETFDTPDVKTSGDKKGRLRKDRYSALLYANYYARNKEKNKPFIIEYKPVGGTKTASTKATIDSGGPLYSGPGLVGCNSPNWLLGGTFTYVKHNK